MKNIIYYLFLLLVVLNSCRDDSLYSVGKTRVTEDMITVNIKDSLYLTESAIDKNYIFRGGDYGKQYTYSDISKVDDNTLLMAAVSEERITDFSYKYLVTSYSTDSGNTWSKPVKINHSVNENYLNVSAPTLLNRGNGHIMLFFGMKYDSKRIDIMYKESFDGGKNWGNDQIVYGKNQGYQTLNNDRVILHNGRIIIPIAVPDKPDDLMESINSAMSVFYYFSDDFGKTWHKSEIFSQNKAAFLEPGITSLSSNELLMNIRMNTGRILFARSLDNGINWNYEYSDVKSPSSPQKIIRINESEKLVMVWNNTDENYASHSGNRSPLSVAVSVDKGKNWKRIVTLESNLSNDYSYPSIMQDSNYVYITYYELDLVKTGYSVKLAKINKKDL